MAESTTRAVTPRRKTRLWVALGCCGVLVLFAIAAAETLAIKWYDPSTAFPWGGAAGSPGQTVTGTDWALTVTDVQRPGRVLDEARFADQRNAKGTFLIVTVRVKNTSGRTVLVKSDLMALHGAAGGNYRLAPAASGYNSDKGGGSLADRVRPAGEATYYLLYDIPPDATGLQFAFAQDRNLIVNLGNAAP